MTRTFFCWKLKKIKDLQTPWISEAMRKFSKQKQKVYIKFLKSKNIEDELIYKNYKNLFWKIKQKIQPKLLFEPISKTQKMADLERNHRKSSKEKLVSTNNTWNGKQHLKWKIISNKNAVAGEFNTFFKNIGPNLANEIPQISKTFDQYFSPVDTLVDQYVLPMILP